MVSKANGDSAINNNLTQIKTYVGSDGKLHFIDASGADAVLNFSSTRVAKVKARITVHDYGANDYVWVYLYYYDKNGNQIKGDCVHAAALEAGETYDFITATLSSV